MLIGLPALQERMAATSAIAAKIIHRMTAFSHQGVRKPHGFIRKAKNKNLNEIYRTNAPARVATIDHNR
jgi:hypothetical protein